MPTVSHRRPGIKEVSDVKVLTDVRVSEPLTEPLRDLLYVTHGADLGEECDGQRIVVLDDLDGHHDVEHFLVQPLAPGRSRWAQPESLLIIQRAGQSFNVLQSPDGSLRCDRCDCCDCVHAIAAGLFR